MSWFTLISAGLQLVLALVTWAKDRQQFDAGQDAEIAKSSLAILKQTDAGKAIMEKIDAMAPAKRDALDDALGTAGQG